MRGNKTIAVLAMSTLAVGVTALGMSTAAFAKSKPHFSNPGVTDTGSLVSGTDLVFSGGTIDGVGVTVSCSTFIATGTVPAKGLVVTLSSPPTISGCSDNLGGTDTVTTSKSGWKLEANKTGTTATLVQPKKSATFTSTALSSCTVTAGPSKIAGSYNDLNAETITDGGPIKTVGKGCTTAGSTVASASITFSADESVVG